jgi:hypothetical protein
MNMAEIWATRGVGACGGVASKTPPLDKLAQGMMRYGHAYDQPLYTPTWVKIMIGLLNCPNFCDTSTMKFI